MHGFILHIGIDKHNWCNNNLIGLLSSMSMWSIVIFNQAIANIASTLMEEMGCIMNTVLTQSGFECCDSWSTTGVTARWPPVLTILYMYCKEGHDCSSSQGTWVWFMVTASFSLYSTLSHNIGHACVKVPAEMWSIVLLTLTWCVIFE